MPCYNRSSSPVRVVIPTHVSVKTLPFQYIPGISSRTCKLFPLEAVLTASSSHRIQPTVDKKNSHHLKSPTKYPNSKVNTNAEAQDPTRCSATVPTQVQHPVSPSAAPNRGKHSQKEPPSLPPVRVIDRCSHRSQSSRANRTCRSLHMRALKLSSKIHRIPNTQSQRQPQVGKFVESPASSSQKTP